MMTKKDIQDYIIDNFINIWLGCYEDSDNKAEAIELLYERFAMDIGHENFEKYGKPIVDKVFHNQHHRLRLEIIGYESVRVKKFLQDPNNWKILC